MWYSSEKPSNNIPHQTPSLNHSLLCAFVAVGPCGHLTSGLNERGRPRATPDRRTITPKTINICIQRPYLWVTPAITYGIHFFSSSRRTRDSRGWILSREPLGLSPAPHQPSYQIGQPVLIEG